MNGVRPHRTIQLALRTLHSLTWETFDAKIVDLVSNSIVEPRFNYGGISAPSFNAIPAGQRCEGCVTTIPVGEASSTQSVQDKSLDDFRCIASVVKWKVVVTLPAVDPRRKIV